MPQKQIHQNIHNSLENIHLANLLEKSSAIEFTLLQEHPHKEYSLIPSDLQLVNDLLKTKMDPKVERIFYKKCLKDEIEDRKLERIIQFVDEIEFDSESSNEGVFEDKGILEKLIISRK